MEANDYEMGKGIHFAHLDKKRRLLWMSWNVEMQCLDGRIQSSSFRKIQRRQNGLMVFIYTVLGDFCTNIGFITANFFKVMPKNAMLVLSLPAGKSYILVFTEKAGLLKTDVSLTLIDLLRTFMCFKIK